MCRILFFACAILNAFAISAQPALSLTNAPFGARYDDLFFINDSTGWGVNALGNIFHTTDGGQSWINQLETEFYFRSVEFLDENTGIAGTLNSVIYRTIDGGETWDDISDAFPESVIGICGLDAVDDQTIFACGNVLEPAFILRSDDQGQSWNYLDMSSQARYLIDIYFLNADTGFCAGLSNESAEGAILFKTTDGGDSWNPVFYSNTFSDTFWKIFQVNHNTLVMSIENFGSANCRYAKSTDRGISWTIIEAFPAPVYTQMIGFFNDTIGYYGNSDLLFTDDGGITWNPALDDTIADAFNRFFQIRPGLAYASSSFVYRLEDTTVTYTGLPLQPAGNSPRQWLGEIYPNPISNTLNFKYGLTFRSRIYLQIHDSQGRIVQRISHTWQSPGEYKISKALSLNQGIYTLVLYTYDGLTSRQFVVGK